MAAVVLVTMGLVGKWMRMTFLLMMMEMEEDLVGRPKKVQMLKNKVLVVEKVGNTFINHQQTNQAQKVDQLQVQTRILNEMKLLYYLKLMY